MLNAMPMMFYVAVLCLQYDRNSLHVASGAGHVAVVTWLVEHGADVHVKNWVSSVFPTLSVCLVSTGECHVVIDWRCLLLCRP